MAKGKGGTGDSSANAVTSVDAPGRRISSPGAPKPEAGPLPPGALLGDRYQIVRFIARGGMGEVYEAIDLTLQSRVAVKTVLPHLANNRVAMERVRREVQLARTVTDAHVCRLFDIGSAQVDGLPVTFITMELLEGVSLRDRLKESGPYSPDEALPLATDLLFGLESCHRAGVIHRDLKTENVILVKRADREHAVLADFGIACLELTEEERIDGEGGLRALTREGTVIGSPSFMAPEQINGSHATQRTDVYGMGAILWELVIGPWPLRGQELMAVARHLSLTPPAKDLPRGLDRTWASVIERALRSDPLDRFASVSELLESLTGGQGVSRPPPARPRRSRASRLPLYGAAAALLLLAAVTTLAAWRRHHAVVAERAVASSQSAVFEQLLLMEFARARELALALDKSVEPAAAESLLARAEAGLGNWDAATSAAQRARADRAHLTRRMQLELEIVERRAAGQLQDVLPLHEALLTIFSDDPLVALEYAEALIPLAQTGKAEELLDGVAKKQPDAKVAARLALDRVLLLYNKPKFESRPLEALGALAVAEARKVDAKVLLGRALAMHGLALYRLGQSDRSTSEIEESLGLLSKEGDRFGLALAHRIKSGVLLESEMKPEDVLREAEYSASLCAAVGDQLNLGHSLNGEAVGLSDLGRPREAVETNAAATAAFLRASRPDLADTRSRPNIASVLDELGRMSAAIQLLTELHERRGPDPIGYEELNLIGELRAGGDLNGAEKHVALLENLLDSNQMETVRSSETLESAINAFERADEGALSKRLAKAEALFKAEGAGEEDQFLLIFKGRQLLAAGSKEAQKALAASAQTQGLRVYSRGVLTAMAARAALKNGDRDAAIALRKAYVAEPRFEQYDGAILESRLLGAELAESPGEMERAAQELQAARERFLSDGYAVARWEAELGLARLALRRANRPLALSLSKGVKAETEKAGFVRLARAADGLAR